MQWSGALMRRVVLVTLVVSGGSVRTAAAADSLVPLSKSEAKAYEACKSVPAPKWQRKRLVSEKRCVHEPIVTWRVVTVKLPNGAVAKYKVQQRTFVKRCFMVYRYVSVVSPEKALEAYRARWKKYVPAEKLHPVRRAGAFHHAAFCAAAFYEDPLLADRLAWEAAKAAAQAFANAGEPAPPLPPLAAEVQAAFAQIDAATVEAIGAAMLPHYSSDEVLEDDSLLIRDEGLAPSPP